MAINQEARVVLDGAIVYTAQYVAPAPVMRGDP